MGLIQWFERRKLRQLADAQQAQVKESAMDWNTWWKSALHAALAGGLAAAADALSSGQITEHAAFVALAGALTGLALYLKQSPLPPVK